MTRIPTLLYTPPKSSAESLRQTVAQRSRKAGAVSLAKKWEEHLKVIENRFTGHLAQHIEDIAKRAFYAGAEAYDKELGPHYGIEPFATLSAEIDHFRSHK